MVGSLKELNGNGSVKWVPIDQREAISGMKWEILQHKSKIPHKDYGNLIRAYNTASDK